jgi:hypothetical protein
MRTVPERDLRTEKGTDRMKNAVLAALAVVLAGIVTPVAAADFTAGPVVVSDPWIRASAGSAMKTGAAYAVLTNNGAEMDRLVAAESPVAERVELHTHLMEGGVMKMRQIEAIEVHPGTPTVLQPGGLHIMFIGLHAPIKEGTAVPLTLVFEKAGRIAISARVLAPGAMSPGPRGPHQGMGAKPAG